MKHLALLPNFLLTARPSRPLPRNTEFPQGWTGRFLVPSPGAGSGQQARACQDGGLVPLLTDVSSAVTFGRGFMDG